MSIKNYMEDMVSDYVDEVASEDTEFCGCPRCRLDVIALSLNHIKPKYVVTPKGYAYARVDELQAQCRADAIIAVTRAMKVVKKRPRHKR